MLPNTHSSLLSHQGVVVFHNKAYFRTAQLKEIADHVWREMEKIGKTLEQYNLSFADIGNGFGQSATKIIKSLSNDFATEWIMQHGEEYRTYHWEILHYMPESISPSTTQT